MINTKKIISIFIAIAMMFALVGVVSAGDGTIDDPITILYVGNSGQYGGDSYLIYPEIFDAPELSAIMYNNPITGTNIISSGITNGNMSGIPTGLYYEVTFVEAYNSSWTGPSDTLHQIAWNTADPTNYTGVNYTAASFADYDIVVYDMIEVWYYPFGSFKFSATLGEPDPVGAYDAAGAAGTTFVALRSASYDYNTGLYTSHLLIYPFAIIDDLTTTQAGTFYRNHPNQQQYLAGFFNSTYIYDSANSLFIGDSNQTSNFIDYVYGI